MTTTPPSLVTRPNANLCVATFGDRPVTAALLRGRWCWRASAVGLAIGYAQGRLLVDQIRGDWSDEFIEGHDYAVLEGSELSEYRALFDSGKAPESNPGRGGARSMVVLYERGIDLALVKARTPAGKRLRRLLADHVLPQLRATGAATLPGAPVTGIAKAEVEAMVARAMDAQRIELREIVAEAFAASRPTPSSPTQCLERDDKGLVLDRELAIARKYLGEGATKGEVVRERGRIDYRLRMMLAWGSRRWCFFPASRVGELRSALEVEERAAGHVAAARAKDRQGSLRLGTPKPPPAKN